ncbi:nuclease-related domain-containing protein [Oceanobacillus bengalensis]|uniref:NERD domain-containing protein n=1 Tax=Oceanobacillus bengalensis TaxID=1435466 RepID=A0A494YVD2_9BACI|nr:nuclease-related domain-containing protein [Oceanobacillus bengalensis]RKQ14150.1 NERD domain-containing protein [Oceanobacillus bengalensis]
MSYKARTKPHDLIVLELLTPRMNLTTKDKHHYYNLKKGYEGELLFDSLTEKLQCECFILNDLLLEANNSTFQIDSLIITAGKIFFYEVKNHEGDYYLESDKLFKRPKLEVTNPLHQLSRSESLLSQLLLSLGYKLPIDASVVFINSKFTLYQAPLDKPIIFPTQVKSYLSNLNATPSKLTTTNRRLADQLISMHITDSPYSKIPTYDYHQLRKGIICPICQSYSVSVVKRRCICGECGHFEPVTNAVLRSVKEFKILFPNEKITSNIVYDWCQVVESKKSISHVLSTNYKKIGDHRWSYYE